MQDISVCKASQAVGCDTATDMSSLLPALLHNWLLCQQTAATLEKPRPAGSAPPQVVGELGVEGRGEQVLGADRDRHACAALRLLLARRQPAGDRPTSLAVAGAARVI